MTVQPPAKRDEPVRLWTCRLRLLQTNTRYAQLQQLIQIKFNQITRIKNYCHLLLYIYSVSHISLIPFCKLLKLWKKSFLYSYHPQTKCYDQISVPWTACNQVPRHFHDLEKKDNVQHKKRNTIHVDETAILFSSTCICSLSQLRSNIKKQWWDCIMNKHLGS
jgi:hypothetical protein